MKSYSTSLSLLSSMARVSANDTTTQALLASFYNDSVHTVCNIRGGTMPFMEGARTVATVASSSAYTIPNAIRKISGLRTTVGTTVYTPTPVYDINTWTQILASELGSSDEPQYYFVQGRTLNIAPASASTAGSMTITGRLNTADLNITDATGPGTIFTATLAGLTIVGNGTNWTDAMIGRYIRINSSGATKQGDNRWYQISGWTSATQITLATPYEGPSIVSGAETWAIGQMSPIPEAYDMAPIYRTLALYNQISTPMSPQSYNTWWKLYDGGQEAGLRDTVGGLLGQMLENEGAVIESPYLSPNDINNLDPNNPPRYPLTGM